MSSTNGKNKIQKKVEASILDAVTKLNSDESSLSQSEKSQSKNKFAIDVEEKSQDKYAASKVIEGESILIGDKSAQVLWDLAKEAPPPPVYIPKAFEYNEIKEPKQEPIDQKTVAIDVHTHKSAYTQATMPATQTDYGPRTGNENNFNLLQLKLYESEHLKIAQKKIEELESSVEKLRIDNERLASASEIFQKRADEALALKQEIEKKLSFNEERFSEERDTFKAHLEHRDQTITELKDKVEHLESRLTTDIRKSRTRERELENRLELARLEKISLVGSKDDIILDLKRQVDQLNHELGNYRRKTAQMNQTLEANQEQFRRTVRALRLALTNLEVNDSIGGPVKKAE